MCVLLSCLRGGKSVAVSCMMSREERDLGQSQSRFPKIAGRGRLFLQSACQIYLLKGGKIPVKSGAKTFQTFVKFFKDHGFLGNFLNRK